MHVRVRLTVLLALIFFGLWHNGSAADLAVDLPPGVQIPESAKPGPEFDVGRATQAYVDVLSPEQRARSGAYFEGGYWLQLWQFVYGLAVLFAILSLRWSVRMRNWAERVTSRRWLQTALYALMYTPLVWLLSLPFAWYTGFAREHAYRLSNHTFGGWLWDEFKGMLMVTVLATIAIVSIYAFIRRAAANWWGWATGFMFAFLLFVFLITPVFLNPIFNKYQPLEDGPVRSAVLSLARANEIPADNVMWFDASKQTKRVSANVSGLFRTTQVSLNDNLLNRTSLPEIKAVMGHEMGHYVLDHPLQGAVFFTLVFGLGFLILERLFERGRKALGRTLWHPRARRSGRPAARACNPERVPVPGNAAHQSIHLRRRVQPTSMGSTLPANHTASPPLRFASALIASSSRRRWRKSCSTTIRAGGGGSRCRCADWGRTRHCSPLPRRRKTAAQPPMPEQRIRKRVG